MFIIMPLIGSAGAREITTSNTFNFIGDGRYTWTVFIVTDQQTWNNISCVEYILHPTFPKPIHNLCGASLKGSPARAFPLSGSGWGEFRIYVRVQFNNGTVRNLDHWLRLQDFY